jgi:hypothetical protein
MHVQASRRLSPALVVAMLALFVALCGTAGAVVTAAVPLAKRALIADKAKFATTAKTANVAKLANKAKTATTATTATTANNALTLSGQSATELIASATTAGTQAALALTPPGARPSTTAAALVSLKQIQVALLADEDKGFNVTCDPGKRALGGGFSSNDSLVAITSFPVNDGTGRSWHVRILNLDSAPASADVYATCLS